jgi:hypothetical protein
MTETDRQEVREIIIDFLLENGSQVGSQKVIDLTEAEMTDEALSALIIPSVRPTTNEWVQTTLKTMMRPITRNIADLGTIKQQTLAARDAANTAASGAENVDAMLVGMTLSITDRQGQTTSVNIGFEIYRTYPSVAAMNADAAGVPAGKFVIIATQDKTSEDNAKMYCKNSQGSFTFLCDIDQASSSAWADWLNNMKPAIQQATTDANNAALNANAKADAAQAAADNADEKAAIANTKAGTAQTAANLANDKAEYAQTQGGYAKQQGDAAALVDASLSGTVLTVKSRTGAVKSVDTKGDKGDKGDGIDYSTMTPAEKQALTEQVAEEIAQQGGYVLYPVDESTLSPSSTFRKNAIICIDGVIYRAVRDTANLPLKFVVESSKFVVQTIYGRTAFVRAANTVNSDWAVWVDASNDIRFRQLEDRVARLETFH